MKDCESTFSLKPPQEIHDLSRIRAGSIEKEGGLLDEKICNYFQNSNIFSEEEIVNHIMIEAYEKDNVFALVTLAEWYRDGIFVEQSDCQYIETLKKILDLPITFNVLWICEDVFHKGMEAYGGDLDVGIYILSRVIGNALKQIGIYYANSSEEEVLCYAKKVLQEALWCGVSNVSDIINRITTKIENLTYKKKVQMSDKIFELREGLYETQLQNADDILKGSFDLVKSEVKKSFKEDNWAKLSNETKTYIMTSMFCYSQLTAIGEGNYECVDFSSVISPLMRGLEYEIRLRFFNYFIPFLRRNYYNVENYANAIHIGINSIAKERKSIIKKIHRNNNIDIYAFRTDEDTSCFSLGSLSRTIGYNPRARDIEIDTPVMEFCKTELLIDSFSDDEIKQWLKELCDNVEVVRPTRNRSSHGGSVLNVEDAEEALERLVLVQKLIEYVVEGCKM